MRYQVPQFIEVEDKIFGPLTLKQFIYLAGGAGLSFVVYVLLGSFALSILPILIILAISAALAFYKVYDHFPLINIAEYAFKYITGKKLYVWRKEERSPEKRKSAADNDVQAISSIILPKVSDSKLHDLSWSLDIKDNPEESPTTNNQ